MSHKVMSSSLASRWTARSGRRAAPVPVVRSVRPWVSVRSALVLLAVGAAVSLPARAASTPPGPASGERGSVSLPRQFSVEVGAGGVLFADGTRLGATSELGRWAKRALAGTRFAGAVVFGDEAREGAAVSEAVEVLRRAGFADVRRAGRPAPVQLSAAARPSGVAPVVSAGKAAVPSPAPNEPRPPAITLATVGLHVDGAFDKEPHRSRLVRVFEHEFGAFRRCHERAERHAQGASFGVDVLIPKTGGQAKVRQTRTRLESKAFRTCMQSAFEAIRFAPPPTARAEIVSYSVLFKPGGQ
jgi:hypothetical protein